MLNVSKNITYKEATLTGTDLYNIPSPKQFANMQLLARMVFEPARTGLGDKPIKINSFFRSKAVNDAAGGVCVSQHLCNDGAAMDMEGIHCSNAELFFYIKNNLKFDQLIWEHGSDVEPQWVHVSYRAQGNRQQVLKCSRVNGKTLYTHF